MITITKTTTLYKFIELYGLHIGELRYSMYDVVL